MLRFHGSNNEGIQVHQLSTWLLNLKDYSSRVRPASGLVPEFTVFDNIIDLIIPCRSVKCSVCIFSIADQCAVLFQADGIVTGIRFKSLIKVWGSEAAVAAKIERHLEILCPVFLQQRDHELICIFAAILCASPQFCFQKVTGNAIIAKKRMVAMSLIMIVEAFIFLCTVCIMQRGVQVKKHMFRSLDRVNNISHLGSDLTQLSEGILIHTVPEPGQCWL